MDEKVDFIVKGGQKHIRNRINGERVLDWMDVHREEVRQMLEALDAVIIRYNEVNAGSLPDMYRNILDLQSRGISVLPSIDELCKNGGMRVFVQMIREMNELMIRGEQDEKQEPYLGFHTVTRRLDDGEEPMDEETLAIGGVLHGYEELLIMNGNVRDFPRDLVLNGLIEALSSQRENPLYDAVFNVGRLNWVDGWKDFSPEFRRENLLN